MIISSDVPQALVTRLDQIAEAEDRTRSAVIRRVLDRALAEHAELLRQAAEISKQTLAGVAVSPVRSATASQTSRLVAPPDSGCSPTSVESGGVSLSYGDKL